MSRPSFKTTLRRDLKYRRTGRRTEITGQGLTYRVDHANASTAALINSKIPVAIIQPPPQP